MCQYCKGTYIDDDNDFWVIAVTKLPYYYGIYYFKTHEFYCINIYFIFYYISSLISIE